MKFKPVTHVIFDMDGLLIESESVYDRIIKEIAAPHGKTYTRELKARILGTPEQETARLAVTEMHLPMTEKEFLKIYHEKVAKLLQSPDLMPGAARLVKHLHNHGIPIAVATSSTKCTMLQKSCKHEELFKLFHHIVAGGDDPEVKNGKPAPDIFLVCASRFDDNPSPEKCLVLEDAPNGILGALAAGMQAVIVPDPELASTINVNATLMIQSLQDFKPEDFGLPKFSPCTCK